MVRPRFAVLLATVGLVAACADDPGGGDTGRSRTDAAADVSGDTTAGPVDPDATTDAGDATPVPDVPDSAADAGADTSDGGPGDTPADDTGAETGPSCETDSDADGLSDCQEARLCTDPHDGDTDGDHLSDFEELQHQTDPCDPDTDGDGATDKEEIDFGLDPNRPNDDLWAIHACDDPKAEPVDFHKNATGNWTLALPPSFANYTELNLTNTSPPVAAAVYDDPATGVAGALLSKTVPSARNEPTETLRNDVRDALRTLGDVRQDQTGGAFETHDGKTAAVGHYLVATKPHPPVSVRHMRQQLLLNLAPFSESDATGFPTTEGKPRTRLRISVSVIVRNRPNGPDQGLIALGVASDKRYTNLDRVQFRMDDLTNTTNIAEQVDTHMVKCETFEAPDTAARAEFYWVLDQSGSMDDHNQKVAQFAEQFEREVSNSSLDYRMGVTNMDEENDGHLRLPPAWHRDPGTFRTEINEAVIGCDDAGPSWHCNGGIESGLVAAKRGIKHMTGNARTAPAAPERVRNTASIITIFMSDEETEVVKDHPNTPYDQVVTPFEQFFSGRTTAFAIVGNGDDCGWQDGRSYKDVALATGGKFASLCAEDLERTIRDIIIASVGESSQFTLRRTPISSSLRVFLNGTWVPRSRENGFEYFEENNSIAFFGRYRPTPQNDGRGPPDYVAVSYETFKDRCKRTGDPRCRPGDE